MASQGMILRNMALVGQTTKREMPPEMRSIFEQGVFLLFKRWTALQLAVQNEWGGSRSAEKAQQLLTDVTEWFYTAKGRRLCYLLICASL
jgi:pre-rRNA-processing protein TSR2